MVGDVNEASHPSSLYIRLFYTLHSNMSDGLELRLLFLFIRKLNRQLCITLIYSSHCIFAAIFFLLLKNFPTVVTHYLFSVAFKVL